MHSGEGFAILNKKSKFKTNEYFLTYHEQHGCQVQKKFTKLGFFNSVANKILCLVRSFKGYNFNLQNNITKLIEESKVAPAHQSRQISRLLVFASHLVKDKKPVLSACVDMCGEARKQLFVNLASDNQKLNKLDNTQKNKLFGNLLRFSELELAEKLLLNGADPLSAEEELLIHLPHFIANPHSQLQKYIVYTTVSGTLCLEIAKPKTITSIIYDLTTDGASSDPQLLLYSAQKCLEMVNDNLEYLCGDNSIKYIINHLRKLEELVAVNDNELSSRINFACTALLHTAAELSNTTALDFALDRKLFSEVYVLFEHGADSDLGNQERHDLFEQFIKDKNFKLARVLFDKGINLVEFEDNDNVERHLSSFLSYCISNKHVLSAQNLILSDCPTQPEIAHGHFYDENALCGAVSYGLIPVVETILSVGDSLKVTDKDGKTLLHLALEKGQFEMADWLAERLDVRAVTKKGRTAYGAVADLEYFTSKPALEQAFLLNDIKNVNKTVSKMTSEQFTQELKNLQKKFPATRVEDFFYKMNPVHLEKVDVIKVPDEVAKGYKVRDLLTMVNDLNFTKPDKPFYINPETLTKAAGGVQEKIQDIKNQLNICVQRIEKREYFRGVPSSGSAEIELFYSMIERAITNTLKLINEMKTDTEERQKKKQERIQTAMTEYIKAAYECGGRLYSVSCSQFVAASKGRDQTFEEDIAEILADFRDMLLQSLIPARDDQNEENHHSVHDYNLLVYHLGKKLGIPGYNMLAEFDELYVGIGLNYEEKEKEFLQKYNSAYIIFDSIKMTLEQTGEYKDKLLDWFKVNLPKDYKQAHFDAIRTELQTIPADKQKAFLQSKDIYPENGMTLEEGIEAERQASYLAEEVTVDMNSPVFQIQPAALAYMLTKLNILKRV